MRVPSIYFESKAQKAKNMQTGQRPPGVSDEDWFGIGHPRGGPYFGCCHVYDKPRGATGHCSGVWRHDHQPVIMKIYWKSPLALVLPPLYFLWEARVFVLSGILAKLGYYKLLERFGVDTSPQ